MTLCGGVSAEGPIKLCGSVTRLKSQGVTTLFPTMQGLPTFDPAVKQPTVK